MSAIHTGSIAVRLRKDGLLEYSGSSENHPITNWTLPDTEQDAQARIPAQRAGSAYETTVLVPDGDELADLADYVHIPQYSAFVRALLRDAQAGKEA